MPQALATVYLHLVFSTKNRAPFLRDKVIRERIFEYMGGVTDTLKCPPIRIGGVEDHCHILARFGREISISQWVKELKRVSCLWIHESNFGLSDFAWQSGYAVFSASQSKLADVIRYIGDQEQHHKRITFQDELRTLFTKHGVEFDEKYVWD